ncbi:zinc finger protein 606-like [Ptychodera flava]|uniref:zinc finger protein 606-like n=1 Tax=Ptychodera flava TaxID=63121 RepID=UPI00396A61A1
MSGDDDVQLLQVFVKTDAMSKTGQSSTEIDNGTRKRETHSSVQSVARSLPIRRVTRLNKLYCQRMFDIVKNKNQIEKMGRLFERSCDNLVKRFKEDKLKDDEKIFILNSLCQDLHVYLKAGKRRPSRNRQRAGDVVKQEEDVKSANQENAGQSNVGRKETRKGAKRKRDHEVTRQSDELSQTACKICKKVCKSKESLNKHMFRHARDRTNESRKVDGSGKVRKNIIGQVKGHHIGKTFDCSECSKRFKTTRDLTAHKIAKHSCSCDVCGKTFYRRQSLNQHMRWHKVDKSTTGDASDKVSDNRELGSSSIGRSDIYPHECLVCNMKFKTVDMLERHADGHSYARLPKCQMCKKALRTKEEAKAHMVTVHSTKLHECSACSDIYLDELTLKKHQKDSHPGLNVEQYKCPKCGEDMKEKWKLEMHVPIHDIDEEGEDGDGGSQNNSGETQTCEPKKLFACKICKLKFVGPWSCILHMNSVHQTGPVRTCNFKCTHCQQNFGERKAMEIHMKERHPDLCEKCTDPNCNEIFATSDHLAMHIKLHHDEKGNKPDDPVRDINNQSGSDTDSVTE